MVVKFFFDHYGFTSSGAVSALVQGLLAKELWKRGLPRKLSGEQTWMSRVISCHALEGFAMRTCTGCPDQLV